MFLQDFTFETEHRPGKNLKHVDCLSRYPLSVKNIAADVSVRIRENQLKDDKLKAIMAVLEKANYDPYKMKNGLLHRAVEGQDLLVVPRLMERQIISDAHNAGHIGVQKMMHGIKQKFWIPHLELKVRQHIGNCVPCILHNKKLGLKEGYLSPIPKGDVPLHTLHMDHVGPMDTTAKQYRYILTVVDSFSIFVWLYPIRTTTAEEVLRKLECWSAAFGNPTRIITDR